MNTNDTTPLIENALPWFPLGTEYIDKYLDKVIQYLKSIYNNPDADLLNDKSFCTTINLLMLRVAEVLAKYKDLPLTDAITASTLDGDTLDKECRITASAVVYAVRFPSGITNEDYEAVAVKYMALLCYLLSLKSHPYSDKLRDIILRCVHSRSITKPGFGMTEVDQFDPETFVFKVCNAEFTTTDGVQWSNGHGSIKITSADMFLYSITRESVLYKENIQATNRSARVKLPQAVKTAAGITVLQEKESGRQSVFDPERFFRECIDARNASVPRILKKYRDEDHLYVRVCEMSYNKIFAQNISQDYETLHLEVKLSKGNESNIRGIYLNDIAVNIRSGAVLKVQYKEELSAFLLEDELLDFIYEDLYTGEPDSEGILCVTDAVLKSTNQRFSYWMTREGIIVCSPGRSTLPIGTKRRVNIVNYDESNDWWIAEITNEENEEDRFYESEIKSELVRHLLEREKERYSEEIRRTYDDKEESLHTLIETDGVCLGFLHKTGAIKSWSTKLSSQDRVDLMDISCILALISDNEADYYYYMLRRYFLKSLIAFAEHKYDLIKSLDGPDNDVSIKRLCVLTTLLQHFDTEEEQVDDDDFSSTLDEAISGIYGKRVATVAKLVQASNRFKGSSNLEPLRVELHREICYSMGVADAIVIQDADGKEDNFPLPAEGPKIEHKVSWVFDNETSEFNESSQSLKCLKTICAYMNDYEGSGEGHLYMGVDEKRRKICGFQDDINVLSAKGILSAGSDINDSYMRTIIQKKIRERFPDTHQNVRPEIKVAEDGTLYIDIAVSPVAEGIVTLDGIPYYRYGSESRVMPPEIEADIRNNKFLLHNDLAAKINNIRKAITTKSYVVLGSYSSTNSNTSENDRLLEVFAFTDNERREAVWGFDPNDRRNKVFMLKRAASVSVLDKKWRYENRHKSSELDIIGFSGEERIPIDITLKTVRARNQFFEQFVCKRSQIPPHTKDGWRLKTELYNQLSLKALCGFYLSLSDDIDINRSPRLCKLINESVEHILDNLPRED